jgi:hypothetical protein
MSLVFPFVLGGHTTMVIIDIVLTLIVMVGVAGKRGGNPK